MKENDKKKGQYRAGPPIIDFWVPILRTKKHDFYMEPSVKFVLRINGSFSEKNRDYFHPSEKDLGQDLHFCMYPFPIRNS